MSTTEAKTTTRNTIQRTLVLEAVQSLYNHPTSDQVYEVVREKHPNISRATVYRNLGFLADRGDILRVEVPNGADRFDLTNSLHYHMKCKHCGQIFDVSIPYKDELSKIGQTDEGFLIDSHQIMFEGICSCCCEK